MIASGGIPVHVERRAASAGEAYNRALDVTTAEIVVFAHQDVYFPAGWEALLREGIRRVAALDPDWALLAPFGVSESGRFLGPVWSSSLGCVVGDEAPAPVPAQSFDELVIVLRRGAGVRFDEELPGFHLYGTDIILTARRRDLQAYIFSMPLVHNDGFHGRLGSDFRQAYRYFRRKWRHELPIRTPILWASWHGLHLPMQMLRMWKSRSKRRAIAVDTSRDPFHFAQICGWE